MQIVADLHVHSRYSRAVSQKMDLFEIARWAKQKGIRLVSTGDWTHPLWFRELTTHLKEVQEGVYRVSEFPDVLFILTAEISSIYSQGGIPRRVHNLVFAPSLKKAEVFNKKLQSVGAKLMSDGRPIVGLSSRNLLEMALSSDENFLMVPAHAWTPWYGIFGSESGFDSISECFGDFARHIYAIETGLSSDPVMNWQIRELEKRSILSFSDAHSGPKLGREATVFVPQKNEKLKGLSEKFSYLDLLRAIKKDPVGPFKIGYTIEFFPEEGKYHWSGHRDCGVRYSPQEVKEKGTICPVCQGRLRIGVENRVIALSDGSISDDNLSYAKSVVGTTFVSDKEKKRAPFVSLVPLLEILVEVAEGSPTKAQKAYESLTSQLGTEFDILINKSYDEIEKYGGASLKEAIRIVRERAVFVDPGFDGVFGKVKIFKDTGGENSSDAQTKEAQQQTLF
ncbi:DNA helicase UvrD [Candidatus Roizmanbacteria bacterium]|nr:DNA helicase UvrD [Candidatus Roizmanbacteria bacterium]